MVTNSAYGIDLGTGNLKIFSLSNHEVLNVKNTIAIVKKNQMYAYGDEAYLMYEKAPDTIQVTFPVAAGVIADFDNMQAMLFEVLENDVNCKIKNSDIVVAVPTDITEVEKKAFFDIFAKAKNKPKSVRICEKPLADALGLGLDITLPTGVMVVDIGADTTEISVISLGGLVLSEILPFGGNRIDDSIVTFMKRKFNLLIGKKTAKTLKENIGSALPGRKDTMVVVGRDVVSGLPIEFEVSAETVYEAMQDDLNSICTSIKMILEKVPPELAQDVVHSGIYLTGGSSLLADLADYFTEVTNIKVNVPEDGALTAAKGLGYVLSEDKYKEFGYTMRSRIFS